MASQTPTIHAHNNTVTLDYAGYPYEIDLDEIQDEASLLRWSFHLCEKSWMTTERLYWVISTIAKLKGFKLHGL